MMNNFRGKVSENTLLKSLNINGMHTKQKISSDHKSKAVNTYIKIEIMHKNIKF